MAVVEEMLLDVDLRPMPTVTVLPALALPPESSTPTAAPLPRPIFDEGIDP